MVEKALQVVGETLEQLCAWAAAGAMFWVFLTTLPAMMTALHDAVKLLELRDKRSLRGSGSCPGGAPQDSEVMAVPLLACSG